MNWSEIAPKIKAIVLDVDGVLTDGTVGYGPDGRVKFFNVKDGHAIRMALRAGLLVGILSGRDDPANRKRAEELGLSFVYVGEKDKRAAFKRLLKEHNLAAEECLYIGDDVTDIPVLRQAGIGVAVCDADEEVKNQADALSTLAGGKGAVRQIIVRLMKAQGIWQQAMARYLEKDEDGA